VVSHHDRVRWVKLPPRWTGWETSGRGGRWSRAPCGAYRSAPSPHASWCFVVYFTSLPAAISQSALQRPENPLKPYLRLRRFASDEPNSVSWANEAASLKSLRPTDAFLCCWGDWRAAHCDRHPCQLSSDASRSGYPRIECTFNPVYTAQATIRCTRGPQLWARQIHTQLHIIRHRPTRPSLYITAAHLTSARLTTLPFLPF
jgi:hypothetical protein